MKTMNVLVFGAGAIGTYIGGSLTHAGHRVTFLEQPDALAELSQRGLRLELPADQVINLPPASLLLAGSLPQALDKGPYDIAIFALKSFDTARLVEAMKDLADGMPPLLCFSNGVDNEPVLEAALGLGKVILGTVTSSVGRRRVGDIILERKRGVGVAAGHPLSVSLVEALDVAGLHARLFDRSVDMKWSKMLTNLPANASAAILDMTAADIFASPDLFRLEMDMLREALAVMRALQMKVVNLPGVPVRLLALGARLPAFIARPLMKKAVGGGRGGKRPSFHIDLHSGRGKSEVEWLNGAVVRHGSGSNVPTPVNRVLTRTLLALTQGELPINTFSLQPGKLIDLVESEKAKG